MRSEAVRTGEQLLKKFQPVLEKPDWLPEGLWPELDDARERHEAAVAQLSDARQAARALGRHFEQEDGARVEAYKTGTEVPKMTDPAEREAQTRDAAAKIDGAREALAEAVGSAVALIETNGPGWIADLDGRQREAQDKREEAARLLAEADRAAAELVRTKRWVGRSAGSNRLARLGHIAYKNVPVPEPDSFEKAGRILIEAHSV